MSDFKYELEQEVKVSCSNEQGSIIGRADYTETENNYFIRYKNASGMAVEQWWAENAIEDA
ncbi:MAG: hypothetical protein GXP14_11295 [Gammaproteobacteria bacterium]|nr:hypothetical protein [Gammaproteobacteria bacterium]